MTSVPADRRLMGIAMRVASATSFALMAAFLKAVSERGVSAPEMIFYRNAVALVVIGAWIALGPGWASVKTRAPLAHLTRSIIGLTSMFFTFLALALLPLGEATALTYAAPVIATLLSGLLLRERIGLRRWAAVAAGFAGVLLIAHPGNGAAPIGILTGVAAAIGQSLVMITVRQISRTEGVAAIVFWFTLFSTLVGALSMPFFGHAHDRATMGLLALAGVGGGLGQISMTSSLRLAPVSVVVPFDYLQIVWSITLGWLIFMTPPTAWVLAGAALIAGSGIYTAYREGVRGRQSCEALAIPEAS